jgi:hypothetical protein
MTGHDDCKSGELKMEMTTAEKIILWVSTVVITAVLCWAVMVLV